MLRECYWILFISSASISDYRYLLGYIGYILFFGSNVIQITNFFKITNIFSYWSIFSQFFPKNEIKTSEKQNKTNQRNTFSNKLMTFSNIVVFLFFFNFCQSEKLYKRKQYISQLKEVAKFLKNYPVMPQLSYRLNDNDTIWDVGLGCESESIDQGRSYVDKDINISRCFFFRYLSYSGSGGIIFVDGGNYSMNINYSMFYNSVCTEKGGAIYFYSSNSCLRMICANSCSCGASYGGQFARLIATQVNQVEYLSISNCSHTTSGWYSIWLNSGYQRVDNANSSMNNAIQCSGVLIYSPSSYSSSHCTFSNNKVSDNMCILFYSTSGTISMSYANIIHNNSPSLGVVTVDGLGSRKMMYCIFNNNHNYLFYVNVGSLEVSHSFIDHAKSFSTLSAVSTSINNSFTNRITHPLQFFNSLHCHADITLIEQKQMISFDQPYLKSFSFSYPMIILMIS